MTLAHESSPLEASQEGTKVRWWEASSFAHAVDQAIALTLPREESVDVIGLLDLDGTYKNHRLFGRSRPHDIAQRTESFARLLNFQHPAEVIVWSARPHIPRKIRTELETVAGNHETPLHYITGLDKWGRQTKFKRGIETILARHSSAHVFAFGDSVHDRRGTEYIARRVNGLVHHFQVGPLRRL